MDECSYKCANCGREVSHEELNKYKESRGIKCPDCSQRILFKKVPINKKPVKSR